MKKIFLIIKYFWIIKNHQITSNNILYRILYKRNDIYILKIQKYLLYMVYNLNFKHIVDDNLFKKNKNKI